MLSVSLSFIFALSAIIVLIVLSALFSGAEVAYFSISKDTAKELEDGNNITDKRVAQLLKSPKNLLATILIANNFVNIGIVILSTYVLSG